ncbi:type 2 isopentenyl-diphosphate Delta-isomerase [Leucobacter sp. GX24907]
MRSDPTDSRALRAERKDDHVRLAQQQRRDAPARNEFDDLEFVHHALDGADAAHVDLSVRIGDWTWDTPFYANGMTGGTQLTTRINRDLAIAARETGMPMACGSMSVALDDAEAARGFAVIREENPSGFVMANLGAGRAPDDAVRAVELLQADALQIHVNPVQETAMPEGTRDFPNWLRSIERIVEASPVPVIAKEVGFGLSRRTIERLRGAGVRIADVSGTGGTDFLRIENARNTDSDYSMLSGFGQSAPACLIDAPRNGIDLLASGGIRHSFDLVKALALGARAVGVAGVFLEALLDGEAEGLIRLVRDWQRQTTALFALLGAARAEDLLTTDVLVRGRLGEFCRLRGIDVVELAQRSRARLS